MPPSLCGSFLTDKRSLVAFTWSITTVLTLIAFVSALVMVLQVHAQYRRMERSYEQQYEYQQQQWEYQQNQEDNSQDQQQQGGSADRQMEEFLLLSSMSSSSMVFAAAYVVAMAVCMVLYGSTAIVGFTSLRGVYIGPCFSDSNQRLKLGIFGGAIVFFANLLLMCAAVLGEVRVDDGRDGREHEEENNMEPYQVEKIATVLAITCLFLAALYTIFAIVLFFFLGDTNENDDDDMEKKDVVTARRGMVNPGGGGVGDPRREKFITMGTESS